LRRSLLAVLAILGFLGGCRGERPAAVPGGSPSPSPTARPQRLVTLAPNLTEIVFALGAGDRLVGVSEHSDFPEAARRIPRVGGLEVDPEKVAALSPDLVLAIAEGSGRGAVASLEAAGVPVLVVPSGSLDAVLEAIRRVGDRIGRANEARTLVDDLSEKRERVRDLSASSRRPRTLLLVWPDPPQAAGSGTFLGNLLEEVGAVNIAGDRPGWPVLSREYLATEPVDLLIVPDSPESRPVWERAFASGALSVGPVSKAPVLRLDEAALTRPGPRVFDMLERLSEAPQIHE
jgi:iron complex transport system substrate-binding protein